MSDYRLEPLPPLPVPPDRRDPDEDRFDTQALAYFIALVNLRNHLDTKFIPVANLILGGIGAVEDALPIIEAATLHLQGIMDVVENIDNVNLVAAHIQNIDLVAFNIPKINGVYVHLDSIDTCASYIVQINKVAAGMHAVVSVSDNIDAVRGAALNALLAQSARDQAQQFAASAAATSGLPVATSVNDGQVLSWAAMAPNEHGGYGKMVWSARSPVATGGTAGVSRPDNVTIIVSEGILSVVPTVIATNSVNGLSRPDGTTITINSTGELKVTEVPLATGYVAGRVKIGQGLSVTADGTLSTRGVTVSSAGPSGGVNGDLWFVYI